MKKARYNIVILGKTGAGKSTLVNTVLGKKVMKTASGLPVTDIGFYDHDITINSTPVTLIDSWGLETGNAEQWQSILRKEFKKRSPETPPESWFHTILYCIGAGGARVETFEIEFMQEVINNGYHIIVVFNKADQATQKDIAELENAIIKKIGNNKPITFINTCCEEKELIGGRKTEIFGINELKLEMCNKFWEAITGRLPQRTLKLIHNYIDEWSKKQKNEAKKKVGIWGAKNFVEKLEKKEFKNFQDELIEKMNNIIQEELMNTIKMFDSFSNIMVNNNKLTFYNIELPELKQATRIVLGSLFHILSATIVLSPLLLIVKKIALTNVHNYIDKLTDNIKIDIDKNETTIREEIKSSVNQLKMKKAEQQTKQK